MKDLIQKLTDIQETALSRKMLTEDGSTPVENKAETLKDVFESIAGMKPIPVVGKEGSSQETGAGFINVTDPALQNLGRTIGDLAAQKKLQIVVPTATQTTGTVKPTATPGGQGQAMGAGKTMAEDGINEKWGEETKVSPSEKGKYAGKNKAELTKQYNKLKASGPHKKGSPEYSKMRELSFAIRAKSDWGKVQESQQVDEKFASQQQAKLMYAAAGDKDVAKKTGVSQKVAKEFIKKSHGQNVSKLPKKVDEAHTGDEAEKKFNKYNAKELDYMLDRAYGRSKPGDAHKQKRAGQAKNAAYNIMWRKKYGDLEEGDIPSTSGIDTMGAGLGAGRSMTTLENVNPEAKEPQVEVIDNAFNRENYKDLIGKKYPKSKAPAYARVKEISEGKKPDFLDLDKDGNKKETMKKAVADKKKQKVKESMNHRISAARLEGRSHGLKGHAHCGKNYGDLEEAKAYHEGYKEGLDECYGMGVYEGGMYEGDMDEGNAFTGALARTPRGGEFSVGGKTFTDHSSLEEYAFESREKIGELSNKTLKSYKDKASKDYERIRKKPEGEASLKDLKNFDKRARGHTLASKKMDKQDQAFESWNNQLKTLINEGVSVSISKGLEGGHDSATVTATDGDTEKLMALVKQAGLGVFGDDEQASNYGAPTDAAMHGGIEVVGDHDGMMGIMKKLAGVEMAGASDYADEENSDRHNDDSESVEATCDGCRMQESKCQCDEEQIHEVETEDQMEFKVSEDESGQEEMGATEAEEDKALAKADAGQDEEDELEESFTFEAINKKLAMLSEESTEEEDEKAEKAGKKVTKDIEYDDKKDKKEKVDEWANGIGGKGKDAEGKGTDASFERDIEFMTKTIAGGLNKPKSTGQTTIPVIAGQENRTEQPSDWATLAGIK